MKRLLQAMIVLVILALFTSPLFSAEQKEIKVGVVAALSGDAAVYSKPFVDTIVFMTEIFNKEGGILGRHLKVIAYDDKGSPAEALNICKKLAYDDKVDIIHPGSTSGCILTAMPVGKAAGLPQFGYGLSDDFIKQGEGMIFRPAPTNTVQLGALAKYTAQQLGVKTVGIIHLDSHFGENQRDVFAETFKRYGGKVLLTRPYTEGERDFNAIGMEMIGAKPNAIVVFAQAGPAATSIRQLSARMPKEMKLIGHNEWSNPTTRKLAGDVINRMDAYCSPLAIAINPDPNVQDWIKRIEAKFNTPFVGEMSRAVVGMEILKIAIQKAGSLDGIKVMKEVHKLKKVKTFLGEFTYDPRDGEALKEAIIVKPVNAEIKNDKVLASVHLEDALYPEPPNFTKYFGEGYFSELMKYHGLKK